MKRCWRDPPTGAQNEIGSLTVDEKAGIRGRIVGELNMLEGIWVIRNMVARVTPQWLWALASASRYVNSTTLTIRSPSAKKKASWTLYFILWPKLRLVSSKPDPSKYTGKRNP
ncbi:hypothetical protein FRC12_004261 [Ceratobasidium sp. 428]|nr:hypothetical protein FRC12_004261 [Ceratobasidium sp. 428]